MPKALRSKASSTSAAVMRLRLPRAAKIADSLTIFARSAPLNPDVRRAKCAKSTSSAKGIFSAWTAKICWRPSGVGNVSSTLRSNLPGRSSASSNASAWFVAATTITLRSDTPKPSISVRSWFKVCSRSDPALPKLLLRFFPIASSSSMKTMHGALDRAFLKMLRMRDAPTPTYISTNSEADTWMIGTPHSPANALAMSVFPVPGGPANSTPRGTCAPTFANADGRRRKPMMSSTSTLASSTPATSANATPVSGSICTSRFDLKPSKPNKLFSTNFAVPTARPTYQTSAATPNQGSTSSSGVLCMAMVTSCSCSNDSKLGVNSGMSMTKRSRTPASPVWTIATLPSL
mmetsp:Transcript_53467/g.162398  ORF Transcript_53467/g.162398 Transcript_53467/m.162398 type:complete len:347 (-) Transcript_53467:268-1308(-)